MLAHSLAWVLAPGTGEAAVAADAGLASGRAGPAVRGADAIPATLPVAGCADDGSAGTLRSVIMPASEGSVIERGALTCSPITLTQRAIDIRAAGPHPIGYLTIQAPAWPF